MKARNPMQLKAIINNFAIANRLEPQLVLQNYYLQRFLERLSKSPYRGNFVIKGGVLVTALLGLANRTTMDIDATAVRLPMGKERLMEVVRDICRVLVDDGIAFTAVDVQSIDDHNDYPGLRVKLLALQPPMKTQFLMDVTTGDSIVPGEVENEMPLLFEDRSIPILTYSLETLLAEKLQTILVRGLLNTRPRDFYDVFILQKMKGGAIRPMSCARRSPAPVGSARPRRCWRKATGFSPL